MRTMGRQGRAVKGKRRYDASSRREQARRNQSRIIEAAERRFLDDGYALTTIAAIAEDAGVSVDTIYKSFGGKPGLVRAVREQALRGGRSAPAEQRSDELQAGELDPRKIIAGWGRLTTEIAPRASPILLLLRDAAGTDPELDVLLGEMDGDRLRRMTDNAGRMQAPGHLRSGITVAIAADVMWTYSSPELYELLVLRRGMSLKRYGQFVADAMISALL
jgi:AcrR family transcriptional regulator